MTEHLATDATLDRDDDPHGTHWSAAAPLKPIRGIGDFFAMALDVFVAMFTPPFAWREFLEQVWFVARVAMLPALFLSIPYVVLTVFTFNVLLVEFGAADYSGSGAALGAVNQIGPFVTVLVVAGAGAAAMCADLGARTIREELDALKVMGIDPIRALVVPRVLAATVVALLLSSWVTLTGLAGGFFFSVFFQHVTPGAFVASLTFITGVGDVLVSMVKATLFGLTAGLIACYLGTSVGGGAAAVGNAVNETVVYSFVLLFVINLVATAVGFEVMK
jgi:phospholipid/cholesterol/gamma-HCH transport system permease protein